MAETARAPSDEGASSLHPSAWLVVPTLALLLGQAVAPWAIAPEALVGLVLPLTVAFSSRWRQWSLVIFIAAAAFALGYARHRDLLLPKFPSNHLRVLMDRNERLYLEGALRHEPEKLTNRTRFQINCV